MFAKPNIILWKSFFNLFSAGIANKRLFAITGAAVAAATVRETGKSPKPRTP
jgi:hypothetical protein